MNFEEEWKIVRDIESLLSRKLKKHSGDFPSHIKQYPKFVHLCILWARNIERIYKISFGRVKRGVMDFSSLNRDIRYIGVSLYRNSIVQYMNHTLGEEP